MSNRPEMLRRALLEASPPGVGDDAPDVLVDPNSPRRQKYHKSITHKSHGAHMPILYRLGVLLLLTLGAAVVATKTLPDPQSFHQSERYEMVCRSTIEEI